MLVEVEVLAESTSDEREQRLSAAIEAYLGAWNSADAEKLRREVERLELERERVDARLASRESDWEADKARLDRRMESLTSELSDAHKELRDATNKAGQAELQASQLTSQKEHAERELAAANDKVAERERRLAAVEEDLRQAQRTASDAEASRDAAQRNQSAIEGERAGQLAAKVAELANAEGKLAEAERARSDAQRQLEQLRADAGNSGSMLADVRGKLAEAERAREDLQRRLDSAQAEIEGLRAELERSQTRPEVRAAGAQTDEDENLAKLARLDAALKNAKVLLDDERTRAGALAKDVEELRVRERQHEQVRRSMHFTIQELKGNVRVFVRVRPQLSVRAGAPAAQCWHRKPAGGRQGLRGCHGLHCA